MAETIENEVAPESTTAVANWQDRLAGYAAEAVVSEIVSGSFISSRGGIIQYQGKPVAGNKLDVIIIDAVNENALYEGAYDSDNPTAPVCFSFSRGTEEQIPHPDSTKKQHDTCKGCPQNEFGSAERGKGKACKNIRRLAMIPADTLTVEAVQAGEIAFMKLPVTSVANWGTYVNTLKAVHGIPPFAIITTVSAVPDPKSQYKVTFTPGAKIVDGDLIGALINRHETQASQDPTPYEASVAKAVPTKASKKF